MFKLFVWFFKFYFEKVENMNIGSVSFKDNLSQTFKQKEEELHDYENKIPAQEQIINELKSLIDEDSDYEPSPIKSKFKKSKEIKHEDLNQELLRYKIENVCIYLLNNNISRN